MKTRATKSIYIDEVDLNIVWDYRIDKPHSRIFFLEINGEKFKRTPANQKKATEIIYEKFDELADTSKWRY